MEKRCAVEKEDYDLAKHKKRQMEEYRARVYAQLELHSLVDTELVGAARPRAGRGTCAGLPCCPQSRRLCRVPTAVAPASPALAGSLQSGKGRARAPRRSSGRGVARRELWERSRRGLSCRERAPGRRCPSDPLGPECARCRRGDGG